MFIVVAAVVVVIVVCCCCCCCCCCVFVVVVVVVVAVVVSSEVVRPGRVVVRSLQVHKFAPEPGKQWYSYERVFPSRRASTSVCICFLT